MPAVIPGLAPGIQLPTRTSSERDARAAIHAHHAVLAEALPIGGADRLDLVLAVGRRRIPDEHHARSFLGERTLALAPLPIPRQHRQAGWKARRHLGREKRRPVVVADGAAVALAQAEQQ